MRRCGRCASCKYRCEDCRSCLGDSRKSKTGCLKRYTCLKSSSYIDEPSLMNSSQKRLRDEDLDPETSMPKGLKISSSPKESEEKVLVDSNQQNSF